MRALMFQIHMKPEVVLLSGFGFRLGSLESLLRLVLKAYAKLDQSCFKKLSVFQAKGKQPVDLLK